MAGSMEPRGPNTWRLIVSVGFNAKGKRVKVSRTFHGTKREAEKALAKLVTDVSEKRVTASSRMTVAEWARIWLSEYAERKLAARTTSAYRHIVEKRIIPVLGKIPLDRLTAMQINQFYAELKEEGVRLDGRGATLSGAMQLKHHRVLSSMLQEAVYRQLIPINPVRAARPPRKTREEARYYDEEQLQALLTALDGEPLRFRVTILLALTSGMRRGELIALEWRDVLWEDATITIRQAAQIVAGKGQSVKSPKTLSSIRQVMVPADVMQMLHEWQVEQCREKEVAGSLWALIEGHDFIWTDWDGSWMLGDQLSKDFRHFIQRHHLRSITLHGLRHTAASLLIALGIPVRTVAGILGHSQSSTTLNIYSHVLNASTRQAAQVMSEVIQRNGP